MTHTISGIQILPKNSIWNTDISTLPTHASSTSSIAAIGGASTRLRAKVSTPAYAPPDGWGIPYNLVTNATPTYMPTFTLASTSFAGPYPIPASPLIEESTALGSDLHLLCLNTDTGTLYELDGAVFSGGAWSAVSGWKWNLASNALPPAGSTAADAASMPVLPGLLLYDEVASGVISHALRVAIPNGSGTYIWPAKHADGSTAGIPPHGSRLRLKANFALASYSAANQVILSALKKYGCFLVDQGTTAELKLYGMPDTRWDNVDLQVLNDTLTVANFEVVDESSLEGDPSLGAAGLSWYDPNFQFKKAITIDHTKVSGSTDLVSFPVLISRIDADLKTVANGGNVRDSNGFDIIFVDNTESTRLDHEIERYVASTGEILMWVRVPTLSPLTDTVIYLYYNNSSISTSQENTTGVWDTHFKGVYHLGNGTTLSASDSTSNASSSNHGASAATGLVDGAASFDGTSSFIQTSLSPSGWTALSLEWWQYLSSTTGYPVPISNAQASSSHTGFDVYFEQSSGQIFLEVGTGSSFLNISFGNGADQVVTLNTWQHLAITLSSTQALLYINGALIRTIPVSFTTLVASATPVSFGYQQATGADFVAGLLDEIRLSSNIARSPAWIATEVSCQSSPSTFSLVGSAISVRSLPTYTLVPPVITWYTATALAPLSSLALPGSGYGGSVPLGTTSNPVTLRAYNNFAANNGLTDALNCTLAVYDDTTYQGQAINPSTTSGYVQVQVLDYDGNQENADTLFVAIGGQNKHPIPTNGGTLSGYGPNYITLQVQLAVPIDASEGAISPGLWLEYSSTS